MSSFKSLYTGFKILLAIGALALGPAAIASPVHVTAQASVNSSVAGSAQFLPIGTTVFIDLNFDISGVGPGSLVLSAVSGQFNWNDGVARQFNVSSGQRDSISSSGAVSLSFFGSGLTINDNTVDALGLRFNVGTDPFNSSEDWYDLLLGAVIDGFTLEASTSNGGSFGGDIGSATGDISAANTVPEPTSLALVALAGLGCIAARRRRRQA